MRMKWIAALAAFAFAVCATTMPAQTSVALSLYGAFSGTTTGNGTAQSPANQAGGIIELRHIANPIEGFEASYSYNRANQTFTTAPEAIACPASGCTISTESVRANAHELALGWVPSFGIGSFRPFGLLGLGLLVNVPTESQAPVTTTNSQSQSTTTTTSPTSTSTKFVYVYGAGIDWGLLPHLGLRFQYRGNLYQTPNVTKLFTSVNTFTHTSEPMIGAYLNF